MTETVTPSAGNDLLIGSSSGYTIDGLAGNDTIVGAEGDDSLTGGAGNDSITGGAGNDSLFGGLGNDVYTYNLNDGNDIIFDTKGTDTLNIIAEGVNPEDIPLSQVGNDLVATFNESDSLTIKNWKLADNKIDTIKVNGSTFSAAEIANNIQSYTGTTLGETIVGNTLDNTIDGGLGNDSLAGGSGDDTYNYASGDGKDTIQGSEGNDTISFDEKVSLSALSFSKSGVEGQGLVIKYGNDSITIEDKDNKTLHLINGNETINLSKVLAGSEAGALIDNSGDLIENAILYGNKGNDTIVAGSGGDEIATGKGNDLITGGAGNDTYYFELGDGKDTIQGAAAGNDVIVLNDTIDPSTVNLLKKGTDITVSYGSSSDSILIKNASETKLSVGDYEVDLSIVSNIGTTASEIITDTANADFIFGNAGNDTMSGGEGDDILIDTKGNDTYLYAVGDGNDTIIDNFGNNTLKFTGVNGIELMKEIGSNDLIIEVNDGANSVQVTDNKQLNIVTTKDDVSTTISSLSLISQTLLLGTDNADTVKNLAFDKYELGKGNDTITDATGNDTYMVSLGDGTDIITDKTGTDTIDFDDNIEVIDLNFSKSSDGKDLKINYGDSLDNVIIKGNSIENIQIGEDTLALKLGSAKAETLVGNSSSLFVGGAGNDTITANAANNTFVFSITDGNDIVINAKSGDNIVFKGIKIEDEVTDMTRSDNDLTFTSTVGNDTQSVTFKDWFLLDENGAEKVFGSITFEDDTMSPEDISSELNVQFDGETYEDEDEGDTFSYPIYSNTADNVILSGEGDDIIIDNKGNDTYQFAIGDGNDTILDTNGNDTISFIDGDVDLGNLGFTKSGDNLLINYKGNDSDDFADSILIKNQFKSANKIETIDFGEDLLDIRNLQVGSTLANDLKGTTLNDVFVSNGGNDTLSGDKGDDLYIVDADVAGNVSIIDTNGNDTIFVQNLASLDELSFAQDVNNLVFKKANGTTLFTLNNYYKNDASKVETLVFSDGNDTTTLNLKILSWVLRQQTA